MRQVTIKKVISEAKELDKEGKKWHFHILTPGCVYNTKVKFALVLENSTDDKQFFAYTIRKPAKAGEKLVKLLHGKKITKPTVKKLKKTVDPKVEQMVKRAVELNSKGFAWHHHVLFPECTFSQDKRYWTLVFEDPLNGEVLESRSKDEPKDAIKKLEPLFYAQKN
jgi:hypothetical protein